jgi:hypothetical protein
MRRNKRLLVIGAGVLLIVALIILGLIFFIFKDSGTSNDHSARSRTTVPITTSKIVNIKGAPVTQPPAALPPVASVHGTIATDPEKAAEIAEKEAEIALANWEAIIDRLYEQDEEINIKRDAPIIKAAFAKLSKEVQEEEIHYALNLLSDEQFPVLYPILFDKTQSEDVLEAIFDDALNRPEEIKNPLMQTLRKDRKHPMYFESARILDAMGMDEDETAKVKTEADDK